MMDRTRMMLPMLEACPSFRPSWEAFLKEWRGEADAPLFQALAELARHLTLLRDAGRTERFPAIFAVVERWFLEGDAHVREAATIGLLEDLQHAPSHAGPPAAAFEAFLGPASRDAWMQLARYWEDLLPAPKTKRP